MTDYTTLRVTEEAKSKAEESKRDDETWNEYILRCHENAPQPKEFVPADAVASPEAIAREFERAFPFEAVAERTVDEMEDRR